jgi:hypothetical protein
MKIIELKAENIKRLKAVTLKPDGKSVVIGGDNDQGKSSVLDSIFYGLGGAGAVCDEPIRRGEKNAEVVLDLGELVVTRRFTPSGSTLVVKTKSGDVKTSPQKILDKLVGALTFDPLAFSRAEAKSQRETLAQLAGLNFAALDTEYQGLYAQRTEANREVARVKAILAGKEIVPGLPEAEISVADLLTDLSNAQEHNRDVEQAAANCRQAKAALERCTQVVAEQLSIISELEARLAESKRQLASYAEKESQARLALEKADEATLFLEAIDEGPLRDAIAGVQEKNSKIQANQIIRDGQLALKNKEEVAHILDKRCNACLGKKQALIEGAKFPLEGLSVSDEAVLFNGIPLQQASSAQQIRISTAIGIALNPTLRVMLIRDGAFLDGKSLAALQELAASSDVQLWIERVGTGDEVSVIIENGEVKE